MSTHTPGPWTVAHEGGAEGGYSIDAKDDVVVSVRGRIEEADARLIAAAPDLLAALKQCMRDPNHYKSYDMAKAAIAKAEGTS